MSTLQEKMRTIVQTSVALGGPGVVLIEKAAGAKESVAKVAGLLRRAAYREGADCADVMDLLSTAKKKIFYVEKSARLDSDMLEIVAEFDAGIVSLADRKNQTGLKTAKFSPRAVSLLVILTRKQLEKSYPRLFEYVRFSITL